MIPLHCHSQCAVLFRCRAPLASCREGVYVRVIGQLRSFNNSKNLTAFNVRPLLDPNELTFHMLETLHVHIAQTRGQDALGARGQPPAAGGFAPHAAPAGGAYQGGAAAPQPQAPVGNQMPALQQEICELLAAHNEDDTGLSLDQLVDKFAGRYGGDKAVRQAVDALQGEGHLYSTIDEAHFKFTG
mmetsp:Transcript_7611/g.20788  ORF Transcript_7611/g.20788 Transcript_7611/m.20788 type:complete len:186 (+) Transcript_7611:599-1156(+)